MTDTDENGVAAITTLLETLRPLKPETRANVLDYVFKTLGITAPPPAALPAAHPPPFVPGAPPPPPAPLAPGGAPDLRMLTEQKNPKSANQMVAVMAHYLADLAPQGERRDYIVAEDIKKYFRQANFPQPTGPHRMTLVNAKNSGFLDALNDGQYRLNAVGHNLVAYKLPKGEKAAPRPARRGKPATKGAKGVKKKQARR